MCQPAPYAPQASHRLQLSASIGGLELTADGTKAKRMPERGWAVIEGGSRPGTGHASLDFFRDALNMLPVPVAVVDRQARLAAANSLWLDGDAGGVLLGRHWQLGENLLQAASYVEPNLVDAACEVTTHLRRILNDTCAARDVMLPCGVGGNQFEQLRMRRFTSGDFNGAQLVIVKSGGPAGSAEHMLTQTRQRYDNLFNTMPVMLHFNDSFGRLTAVNDHWLGKLGYDRNEVLGRPAADYFSPQSRHLLASHYDRQITSQGSLENVPVQMVTKAGVLIDVLLGSSVETDEVGNLVAICARMVDITDRNRAETALRKSEGRFERAVRGTSDGLWDWDLESGHVWYAPRFKELLGYEPDEFADNFTSFKESLHPDDRGGTLAAISQRLDGEAFDIECRLKSKTGSFRWFRVRGLAHQGDDGTPRRMAGSIQDITLQKLSEQALLDNRNFYELILDSVPAQIAYVDATLRVQFINRACAALLEVTKKAAIGRRLDELIPAERFRAMDAALTAVLDREAQHLDMNWPLEQGTVRLEIDFLPHKTIEGRVLGFFWLARDVTTHRQLEAELRQAQKMEAVGQLTGGIAHDFNNLLSVILGNLQLLERRVGGDGTLARKVATAKRAAIRGAELTRRLLAFARQQVLEPEVLALDALVSSMEDLLTRTLGQYIEVSIHSDPQLWSVEADPGQLENCLLNLAINARDAMPDGGQLRIETRNASLGADVLAEHPDVEPGDYVMLGVEDTGSGIDPDMLDQVVEPFFTTKEVGKGTGLGLSTVFGFAKQSGGHARITSSVGQGTCVRLYFPRCHKPAEPDTYSPESSNLAALPRGGETLLVVEDDGDVRETAVTMLAELGYRILAAASAAEALEILRSGQVVDLLFTDVMMPGMRGTQLTAKARELCPELKVLYTTGFTATGILQQEVLAPGADLIGKPYRAEDLAVMIRRSLDGDECDG